MPCAMVRRRPPLTGLLLVALLAAAAACAPAAVATASPVAHSGSAVAKATTTASATHAAATPAAGATAAHATSSSSTAAAVGSGSPAVTPQQVLPPLFNGEGVAATGTAAPAAAASSTATATTAATAAPAAGGGLFGAALPANVLPFFPGPAVIAGSAAPAAAAATASTAGGPAFGGPALPSTSSSSATATSSSSSFASSSSASSVPAGAAFVGAPTGAAFVGTPASSTAGSATNAAAGARSGSGPSSSAGATASATAGAAAAPAGGPASPPCVTLVRSASSSCANGACCDVKQRVTACPGHTTALAEVNGAKGACCVVLVNEKSGKPAAFCATPSPRPDARQFPGGVAVSLNPSCSANAGATAAAPNGASLGCTAVWPYIPKGFRLPKAGVAAGAAWAVDARAAPWTAARGLAPCGHAAYRRFSQGVELDPATGAATFTVNCAP